MTEIGIETTFDACHRLMNYEGNCRNCHGHTWKVKIEISTERELDDCQMLIDFRKIKTYINGIWDHHAILNKDDPLIEIFEKMDLKVCIIDGNPTAENIAKKIVSDIVFLADLNDKKAHSHIKVAVYESEKTFAKEELII